MRSCTIGFIQTLASLTVATCLAPAAQASQIGFQTRATTTAGFSDANDARDTVEALMAVAPGAGFCDASPASWSGLSNQLTCGQSGLPVAFDISASFVVTAAQAGVWSIRIGPDFGLGGALFVDGVALDFRATDLWWDGSYADPTQLLAGSVNLGAGSHVVEVYGRDACCDGPQEAQFLAPAAPGYVTFGHADGLAPVPEPANAVLALLGLGLLGWRWRRTVV